jgi:hypothetical protein
MRITHAAAVVGFWELPVSGAESRPPGIDVARQSLFIATIALSSFLLFAMELLFGVLLLPTFGGAPSVWTTALCFFTAVVFLGYLYSHFIATKLSPRVGASVHTLVATAALALTIASPRTLIGTKLPGVPAALAVLGVLGLAAGPCALLLATTTPLVSHWFAREGRSPWWLYAVSNGASLAGLLGYPFLIEPFTPLSAQRTALEVLLAILVALLIVLALSAQGRAVEGEVRADQGTPVEDVAPAGLPIDASPSATRPLTLSRQAVWLFAAFVPAGLMAATTTHITTDHVSAPLIWVGPLGVYLGTLVIAFSNRGRVFVRIAETLAPAAATLMWIAWILRVDWPAVLLVPLLLACLAATSLAVHGRLALDKPDVSHLTRFYLLLSAGGMIATAFVALVAPVVFNDIYEYPLLVVASLVALALFRDKGSGRTRESLRALAVRVGSYVVVAAIIWIAFSSSPPATTLFVATALAVGLVTLIAARSPAWLAGLSAVAIVALWLAFTPVPLVRVRSFFGVTQVRIADNGAAHEELHGTTLHGLQFLDARHNQPTAYFVRSGPLGDVFAHLDQQRPRGAGVGVTGLGVGTIAAYERSTDHMTFFEIDPSVVSIARDSRYFRYLADAPNKPRIVVGDGRLSLAVQPSGSLDLLVLDAFSSDTLPTHLLTAQAMQTYLRALSSTGVMAFNVTNRHYDLAPALSGTARSIGLAACERRYVPNPRDALAMGALPSEWVVIGRATNVAWFERHGWTQSASGVVLTDDFSDVTRLIRWF